MENMKINLINRILFGLESVIDEEVKYFTNEDLEWDTSEDGNFEGAPEHMKEEIRDQAYEYLMNIMIAARLPE